MAMTVRYQSRAKAHYVKANKLEIIDTKLPQFPLNPEFITLPKITRARLCDTYPGKFEKEQIEYVPFSNGVLARYASDYRLSAFGNTHTSASQTLDNVITHGGQIRAIPYSNNWRNLIIYDHVGHIASVLERIGFTKRTLKKVIPKSKTVPEFSCWFAHFDHGKESFINLFGIGLTEDDAVEDAARRLQNYFLSEPFPKPDGRRTIDLDALQTDIKEADEAITAIENAEEYQSIVLAKEIADAEMLVKERESSGGAMTPGLLGKTVDACERAFSHVIEKAEKDPKIIEKIGKAYAANPPKQEEGIHKIMSKVVPGYVFPKEEKDMTEDEILASKIKRHVADNASLEQDTPLPPRPNKPVVQKEWNVKAPSYQQGTEKLPSPKPVPVVHKKKITPDFSAPTVVQFSCKHKPHCSEPESSDEENYLILKPCTRKAARRAHKNQDIKYRQEDQMAIGRFLAAASDKIKRHGKKEVMRELSKFIQSLESDSD
jgi:hypothetical protein